jgi:hypothetical protein
VAFPRPDNTIQCPDRSAVLHSSLFKEGWQPYDYNKRGSHGPRPVTAAYIDTLDASDWRFRVDMVSVGGIPSCDRVFSERREFRHGSRAASSTSDEVRLPSEGYVEGRGRLRGSTAVRGE